jgi:hypothetical protein
LWHAVCCQRHKKNSVGHDASSRPIEFFFRWSQQNFRWARWILIAWFARNFLYHTTPRRVVQKKNSIP